jgi:hypothetical protein
VNVGVAAFGQNQEFRAGAAGGGETPGVVDRHDSVLLSMDEEDSPGDAGDLALGREVATP